MTTNRAIAYEVTSKGDTKAIQEAGEDISGSASRGEKAWGGLKTALKAGTVALAAATAAATAAGGAIFTLTKNIASQGDDLQKMGLRTGMSAEQLSKLSFTAQLAGTDLARMENTIRRSARAMVEAERGSETYAQAFRRFGVDIKDSDGNLRNFADILPDLADGLDRAGSETEIIGALTQAFGRSGAELLPILRAGSDAIREQYQEAERLGGVWSNVAAEHSAQFVDSQLRVQTVLGSVKREFAESFLPVFASGLNLLADRASELRDESQMLGETTSTWVIPTFSAAAKTAIILGGAIDLAKISFAGIGFTVTKSLKAMTLAEAAILRLKTAYNRTDAEQAQIDALLAQAAATDDTADAFINLATRGSEGLASIKDRLAEVDQFTDDWRENLEDLRKKVNETAGSEGGSGGGVGGLSTSLKTFRRDAELVEPTLKRVVWQLGDMTSEERELRDSILEAFDSLETFSDSLRRYRAESLAAERATFDLGAAIDESMEIAPLKPSKPPKLDGGFLSDVKGLFDGNSAFGQGITSTVGSLLSGDSMTSAIKNGMTAGLEIGLNAVIPGLGTLARPLIGALSNLFRGTITAGDELSKTFGMSLSEALTAEIQRVGDQHGRDYGAAFRLSLKQVIAEVGVQSREDLNFFLEQSRLLLADFDRGSISSSEALGAIKGNLSELLPLMDKFGISIETLTKPGGLFSDLVNRTKMGQFSIEDLREVYKQIRAELEVPPNPDPFSGWATSIGVNMSTTARDIRLQWKGLGESMGLSNELAMKIMGEELKRYNQSARQAFREHFDDFNLTEEEKKEAVRAAMQKRRQDMRAAQREEREQERKTRQMQRKLLRDLRRLFREVFGGMAEDSGDAADQQVDDAYRAGDAWVYNADRAASAWAFAGGGSAGRSGPRPRAAGSAVSSSAPARLAPFAGSAGGQQPVVLQINVPPGVDRNFMRWLQGMFHDASVAGRGGV